MASEYLYGIWAENIEEVPAELVARRVEALSDNLNSIIVHKSIYDPQVIDILNEMHKWEHINEED